MNCAVTVICLGFLCLQFIDCVNSSSSTCLDYICANVISSNYGFHLYRNYTCVHSCWLDYIYNTSWYILNDTCESCWQDYMNSTNDTSWYTLYHTCWYYCSQDYANYTLYATCDNNCEIYCYCPPDHAFIAYNVVMLLAVVLPVIAANTALLVALILESSIAKVVRLVLASILISCLFTALGLAMFHSAGIVLSLSPMNNPPVQPCTITVFLGLLGAGARLVFMATFAIVIYVVVKRGEAAKKHTVVAFLVAVAVLWVIAFLGTSPFFSQEVVITQYWPTYYCYPDISIVNEQYTYIFVGLYLFFFSVLAPSVAVIFLLTVCFKRQNITTVEKSMVKFGFFLLLGNGLNMIGLLVPILIVITARSHVADGDQEGVINLIYAAYTLLSAGLIPTPILILIFFKSIRKRLLYWLCCCCMAKKRKVKRNRKNNNAEGRMVTTGV